MERSSESTASFETESCFMARGGREKRSWRRRWLESLSSNTVACRRPVFTISNVGETESHIETLFLRSDLIRALAENPAPTVPALCRRLGISTSRVYCLHGDLARAIAARHLRERAESMERRRELLRRDVFAIVKNMLDRGEPPIQARVRRML